MKRRHEIERKRLPKIQRDEIKAKSQQYRKSIRMEKRVSVDIEREMMKEVGCKRHYWCYKQSFVVNNSVF